MSGRSGGCSRIPSWSFVWAVATGAGDKRPDFILEHPEDPNEYLKAGGKVSQWALPEMQSLTSLWAFPELRFFKEVLGASPSQAHSDPGHDPMSSRAPGNEGSICGLGGGT